MQKTLRLFGRIVDILSATLVLAVLAVLIVGIFYRYCLHSPLFWSDMLATNLFTWLLFLGTAVSVRNGTMFKIEMLTGGFSPARKMVHRTFVTAICVFVYGVVAWHGWELTAEQAKMQLLAFPQLFPTVNFAWVYICIPIAFALMIVGELNNLYLFITETRQG